MGISYARDSGQKNGPVNNNDSEIVTDIIDIAANYGGSFGGLDVNASARYGTSSISGTGPDPEIWGAGLNFGMSGFTIGGSFAEQNDAGSKDGSSFDVGIGYSNGPWSTSLSYFEGNNVDNEDFADVKAVAGLNLNSPDHAIKAIPASTGHAGMNTEELKTIVLAVKYTVSSNFSVGAFIADSSFSESVGPADDVDGTVVGIGASFSF